MTISVIKIRAPIRFADALQMQHSQAAELEQCSQRLAKLFLLQHTPVFTLGRKTEKAHLPRDINNLVTRTGAEIIEAHRGGSVTYHGPGQLIAYLLLNLRVWNITIHQHLDMLEAVAINTLARFGIQGRREPGMTGVWVENLPGSSEKICAIGVGARRWITYHGLSLNVELDLQPFSEIIPCGLAGKRVTSMARVLARSVSINAVETAMIATFGEVYDAKIETISYHATKK
ncbi:MAG: lipoyl(octanoyl) transferase LipB [Planctomycetota bacterium]